MQEEFSMVMETFLSMPLSSADQVLAIFSKLPGAIVGTGEKPLSRFVYVPGKRKNRVLLTAHADTVWDNAYQNPQETTVVCKEGIYSGTNPSCGIGADDRAGCAMLWALRDSGHSLLVTDGEEKGKHGARYLRKCNRALFRELNRHQFIIELDWQGTDGCLYNQVDYTEKFKSYITENLGFRDDEAKGGSDLQILCRRICGVNLGVGYHLYHRPGENLNAAQWENTLQKLTVFLQTEHPRFPISISKRVRTDLRKIKSVIGKILRKLKLRK